MPLTYEDPVPAPWDDLPEGMALFMAAHRESTAAEFVELAHVRATRAVAYADHATALALALGSVTYAEVARLTEMTRQGARKRYQPTVDVLRAEADAMASTRAGEALLAGWEA